MLLKKFNGNVFKKKIQTFAFKHKVKLSIFFVLGIFYLFCLPRELFKDPKSTVLLDKDGNFIGARIAADEQWRFPNRNRVPEKFEASLIRFEDKRFYYHPGFDPLAMLRAIRLNLSQGKIVSGGSTLSMQVIRLARKGKGRTLWEKCVELVLATRLEFRYSKKEILALYASHAPYGGNVVGIDAAAWKYFGRDADHLSWAESAMLAVLPNAPSLIHPGKNRRSLFDKRNRLLDRLLENGVMDSITCVLAKEEPLPEKPLPIPSFAPHLLENFHQEHLVNEKKGAIIQSTLDLSLQKNANQVVEQQMYHLRDKGIHNAAALIVDVSSGDVLSYVGNVDPMNPKNRIHGSAVDVIPSRRSSGSILKPFLFASMLQAGEILPNSLIPDVPTSYGSYTPKNYNYTYDGAVPARRALSRSLNVPAVHMLQQHGIPKFHAELKKFGITTLDYSPSHYGLTLILGGAETSLWDLAGVYTSMSRALKNFSHYNGKYDRDEFRPLNLLLENSKERLTYKAFDQLVSQAPLSAASIYHTFEAMVAVTRPQEERYWQRFSSSRKIAWKTGTSFGFRDAWAIGCTPGYVVAVWVGNADGEGRPGLVGAEAAAPIMFDLFNMLGSSNSWFRPPYDEMSLVSICRESGHIATDQCTKIDSIWIPNTGKKTMTCSYNEIIYLANDSNERVHGNCEDPLNMRKEIYFVLPPHQEKYYKQHHPSYSMIPPFRSDCRNLEGAGTSLASMEIIYPRFTSKIYVPVDLDGTIGSTVFEVAHRHEETIIHWHLDDQYLGNTQHIHELALNPPPGKYTLTLVDENGEKLSRSFEIMQN